tara:strand:+ start:241 stop:549 length:309 start_codon:yes stop_codon:yes gene_type:complete
MFCPKCSALLVLNPEKGKLNCMCGYTPRTQKDVILKEKIEKQGVIEVMDEKSLKTNPKVKEDCKKCGNGWSYYWLVQTRASDEAETKFFECTKCKHRWRVNE